MLWKTGGLSSPCRRFICCVMENTSSLDLIRRPGRMTLGVELPLDNDWSPAGEARRVAAGRPSGVPDLGAQADLVSWAEDLGFSAVWARDVPVFDQINMGDAGSVHDVFVLLGYLAGITRRIALGGRGAADPPSVDGGEGGRFGRCAVGRPADPWRRLGRPSGRIPAAGP
jgi:hypothetical protein